MAEVCGECGLEFGNAAELVAHEKEAHQIDSKHLETAPEGPSPPRGAPETKREEPFTCSVCGEIFPTREKLARHNLSGHTEVGVPTVA